jgi:hypothetical protein
MGDKVMIHWQIPPTSFPLADVRRSLPDSRRAFKLGAVDHGHYADNCVEIDMIEECAGRRAAEGSPSSSCGGRRDGQIIPQTLANACDHAGILALCDLIAAHHVIPRDDLASFGIDVLLIQLIARFSG